MGKATPRIPRQNKHHIVYPESVFQRLGMYGEMLRGAFVVRIDCDIHKQLHDEIDRTLGRYVCSNKLPSEETLKYLCRQFKRNERAIRKMGPIDKIKWLESRLSWSDARNHWLKTMLRQQREFLENHIGEL